MGAVKTLHVVGYKNSGKTTLIAHWVRLLKDNGLTVAVLKHHGHNSALEMPGEETDSMQYFNSGADVSVVAGGGAVQFYMNEEPDFSQLKEISTLGNPDILLVEGYKDEQGAKVVMLRNKSDWDDLQIVDGIALTVGNTDNDFGVMTIISRTDNERLDQWLLNWIGEENRNETV